MNARRPRFSLLTLILLLTCAALALGVWRTHQKAAPLNQEIRQLNRQVADLNHRIANEIGVVNIDDPSRMYVVPISSPPFLFQHFRWRAYVPPGCVARFEFKLPNLVGNVTHFHSGYLKEGHSTFEFVAYRPVVGEGWQYDLSSPLGGGSSGMRGPRPPWLANDGSIVEGPKQRVAPKGLAVGDSFDLIRHSAKDADGNKFELVLSVTLGVN